jgi:hypothetical protein
LWQPLVPIFAQNFSQELHQSQCNGHNFPLMGKLAYTFTSSFRSMCQGRTHILERGVLVLVGLWHSGSVICPEFH